MKEVEAMKKQKEEEKKQQREVARLEKKKQLEEKKKQNLQAGLEGLVSNGCHSCYLERLICFLFR